MVVHALASVGENDAATAIVERVKGGDRATRRRCCLAFGQGAFRRLLAGVGRPPDTPIYPSHLDEPAREACRKVIEAVRPLTANLSEAGVCDDGIDVAAARLAVNAGVLSGDGADPRLLAALAAWRPLPLDLVRMFVLHGVGIETIPARLREDYPDEARVRLLAARLEIEAGENPRTVLQEALKIVQPDTFAGEAAEEAAELLGQAAAAVTDDPMMFDEMMRQHAVLLPNASDERDVWRAIWHLRRGERAEAGPLVKRCATTPARTGCSWTRSSGNPTATGPARLARCPPPLS